jgi:hypothetical protein
MQGYALPPKRPSWKPPLAQEQWSAPQTQDTGYGLPPPKPQWEAPRAQQQWETPQTETRGYALNEPPPKKASPTEPQPFPRAEEAAPLPEQPVAPPAKTEPTATKRSDPQRITKYKGYELRTKAPHVQTGRYMKGWDIYKDGKLVTSSDASLGEVKKKVDAFPEFRIIESPSPIADSLKAVASGKEPAFSNASRKTFEKLAGQKYATDKELARAVLEKMDDGELGPKLKRPSPKKKPTSSR